MRKILLLLLSFVHFSFIFCVNIQLPVPEGENGREIDLDGIDTISQMPLSEASRFAEVITDAIKEDEPLKKSESSIKSKYFYHYYAADSIDQYLKHQILKLGEARPQDPVNRQPIKRIYFYTYKEGQMRRDELVLEPPFAIQEEVIVHQPSDPLEDLLQELRPDARRDRYDQASQTLDLSDLSLEDENIPEDFLTRLTIILPDLKTLDISDNQLKTLPDSIGNLANLEYLLVDENQLKTLPVSIGNLANLKELHVCYNQLKTLPVSIGNLANLQKLVVMNNQLKTLPDSIGDLANLKTLFVDKNQLKTLPDSIGNLANLKTLSISDNQLQALPDSIGNLANLKNLDISDNQLQALPDSIGNLANLKNLDISDNQLRLSTLPDSIGNLANLKKLAISDNKLKTLPDSIGKLDKLRNLFVNGNPDLVISDNLRDKLSENRVKLIEN